MAKQLTLSPFFKKPRLQTEESSDQGGRQEKLIGPGNEGETTMASKDTLPTVKRERLESQTMASEDTHSAVKRERLESQDREKHKSSHTISFHAPLQPVHDIPCRKAGTVLEALKISRGFTSLVSNNKGKDIVIEITKPENADIATHFPCWLIKEKLTIKFSPGTKSDPERPETATQQHVQKFTEEDDLVTFYVKRSGGDNCSSKKYLKNRSTICNKITYLCIYACVEETVKDALERDGRFKEMVFKEGSELVDIKDQTVRDIYLPVDKQLDGKTFRVNMQKEKNIPSQSTTGTNSGSRITKQAAEPAQEQKKFTTSSAKSAPANPPAQEQGESTSRSARSFHAMPDSEELLQLLRSQFNGLVKQMKEREKVKGSGKVLELLREEFGKNTKEFWDVCRVKNLMKMSESVCHIKNTSSDKQGTGFLLFDHFILTNAHLINDFNDTIWVSFRYETENIPNYLRVKKVIAKAKFSNKKKELDYAVLELDESTMEKLPQPLPPPLLTQFGSPIQSGGVCIIGHPEGGVKRVDFCSIIDYTQVKIGLPDSDIKQKLLQWVNWNLNVVVKNRMIPYNTCFFHGASGSPVFDKYGQVVAMHTGGYIEEGDVKLVEYAGSLQPILEDFLRKMTEEQRLNIRQRFIEVAKTNKSLHPLIAGYNQPDPGSPEPMDISSH